MLGEVAEGHSPLANTLCQTAGQRRSGSGRVRRDGAEDTKRREGNSKPCSGDPLRDPTALPPSAQQNPLGTAPPSHTPPAAQPLARIPSCWVLPSALGACSCLPEPILMSPLCWMKMVSLVRLPWMMGGSQECRKLGKHKAALSTCPGPSPGKSRTAEVTASLPESREDLSAPALPGLEQRPELSVRRSRAQQSPEPDQVTPTYRPATGESALH